MCDLHHHPNWPYDVVFGTAFKRLFVGAVPGFIVVAEQGLGFTKFPYYGMKMEL